MKKCLKLIIILAVFFTHVVTYDNKALESKIEYEFVKFTAEEFKQEIMKDENIDAETKKELLFNIVWREYSHLYRWRDESLF